MELYSISYRDEIIEYELHRKDVKNINLRISKDMILKVSVNKRVSVEYIEKIIKKKIVWIKKTKEKFRNNIVIKSLNREYISGENIRYLGKQYRLKVEESNCNDVSLYRGYIHIYVKDKDDSEMKKFLFEKWLREKASKAIVESFDKMYEKVKIFNIAKPELKIRKMKSRWGSCNTVKKKITINEELIKAPKDCIDYVVLHELAHLLYRGHNKKFYNFIYSIMPDWKEKKRIIDEEVQRYI